MKKIFTLLVAAVAMLSMRAADFEIVHGKDYTPVANGETIEVGYVLDDQSFDGFTFYIYTMDAELFLRGTNGENITVVVEAQKPLKVCSIDGNCEQGTSVTKKGSLGGHDVVATDGSIVTQDLKIEAEYTDMDGVNVQDLIKPFTGKVTVYPTANPSNKIVVNLSFVCKPASEIGSVASAAADTEYIRMTGGTTLSYNVSAPATLQLYAITGNLVGRYRIADAGTINLSSLPKGIYIYTDGTRKGKLLVR